MNRNRLHDIHEQIPTSLENGEDESGVEDRNPKPTETTVLAAIVIFQRSYLPDTLRIHDCFAPHVE